MLRGGIGQVRPRGGRGGWKITLAVVLRTAVVCVHSLAKSFEKHDQRGGFVGDATMKKILKGNVGFGRLYRV